jgi:hypothetical protein
MLCAYWQLIKYLGIGLFSALLFLAFCFLFRLIASLVLGASYTNYRLYWNLAEVSFAFFLTNAFTYEMNKKWVFVSGRYLPKKEFRLFTIASLFSLILAQLCVYSLVTHSHIGDFLIKLFVILICTIFNYSFRKFVVFVR